MGVVAGVRGRPVAPQAGVALAVGAGGVARCAAELRRAAAGADGTLAWEEPTSNCGIKHTILSHISYLCVRMHGAGSDAVPFFFCCFVWIK